MIRTGRLYRADPRQLALHQSGQCFPEPDGDGQCLHVRIGRFVRFHGRRHDRELRWQHHRPWHDGTGRRDRHRGGPAPIWCARRGFTGASRTTSISFGIALCRGERRREWIVPTPSCRTWSPATFRLPWEDQVKVTDRHLLRLSAPHPHLWAEDRQGGGIIPHSRVFLAGAIVAGIVRALG